MATPQPPAANLPAYFTKLAAVYPVSTVRSTERLFAQLLPELAPIDSDSVIHDNASGPATATTALLANEKIASLKPKIICTDMVPPMIEGVHDLIKEKSWTDVEGRVMKSDEPMDLLDEYFTHSITNFSIFNFTDRVKAMSEIHRTLKPGGQALITTWKRWTAGDIIHETQRRIRPDLPLMIFSGPEMYDGQAVVEVLLKGGFSEENIKVAEGTHLTPGSELSPLIKFLSGLFVAAAKNGYSDDESAQWNTVLETVVDEHKAQNGGILWEMYAVFATK